MARVPLVVLMKAVRPACSSRRNAPGLFPRSNPAGGRQFSSPQRIRSPACRPAAAAASETLPNTRISTTPAASAAAIVVVARRTSKTTTVRLLSWCGSSNPGRRTTSRFTARTIGELHAPDNRRRSQQRHGVHVHRDLLPAREPALVTHGGQHALERRGGG